MTTRVGWYAHHHGLGHLARTGAVAPHLRSAVTVVTSAGADAGSKREIEALSAAGIQVRELPLDLPTGSEPALPNPPPGLHYAPVGAASLQSRMAALAGYFAQVAPDLLVVDVSVEVAMFARLCGVPVAIVRQHGDRGDFAHRLAYAWAEELLAPYPRWLEDPSASLAVRRATRYTGGFPARPAVRRMPEPGRVVVLSGRGDGGFDPDDVESAAAACPGTDWLLAGPRHWRADVAELIGSAEVVVSHAGHNAVMEVAAARRPLVCIPRPRPFGEQHGKAEALRRAGAAVVLERWCAPAEWPGVLAAARTLGAERLAAAVDPDAAARLAARIDSLAARLRSGDASALDLVGCGAPHDLEPFPV
jgi:UDP-N-acetylglucosamine--N-acetylmuramyl-(pentapeptide) pyrophosphoryl-undecaprenol N-acetylglucosamine transferase